MATFLHGPQEPPRPRSSWLHSPGLGSSDLLQRADPVLDVVRGCELVAPHGEDVDGDRLEAPTGRALTEELGYRRSRRLPPGRDGEDLAVGLEDGAGAGRRDVGADDPLGHRLEVRPRRREVAGDADLDAAGLAGRGIEEVDRAELLVDDGVGAGARGLDVLAVGGRGELAGKQERRATGDG